MHWETGWWARIKESTVQQDLLVGPDHVATPALPSPVDEPSETIRNADDGCIFFCLFFFRDRRIFTWARSTRQHRRGGNYTRRSGNKGCRVWEGNVWGFYGVKLAHIWVSRVCFLFFSFLSSLVSVQIIFLFCGFLPFSYSPLASTLFSFFLFLVFTLDNLCSKPAFNFQRCLRFISESQSLYHRTPSPLISALEATGPKSPEIDHRALVAGDDGPD